MDAGNALPVSSRVRWMHLAVAMLTSVYLLQAVSPLRLTTDSVHYLSVAESIATGRGFPASMTPFGYPLLIAALDQVGLAASWVFILVNCAFMAAGLAAFSATARRAWNYDSAQVLLVTCLTLLSFVVIKHVTMPLTDVPFFGVSLGALAALVVAERVRGRRRGIALSIAFVLVTIAVLLRTIGIALVPAALWTSLEGNDPVLRAFTLWRRHRAVSLFLLAILLGGGLAAVLLLARSTYVQAAMQAYGSGPLSSTVQMLAAFRLREWGDLASNVPARRLPPSLTPGALVMGAAAFAMVLRGIWMRRRCLGPLEVYGIAFICIMSVWPWYDPRFWLPLFPLLVGWALQGMSGSRPTTVKRLGAMVYLLAFIATGVTALVYSTRISLAGSRFPEVYGDGTMRSTYRAAFGQATSSDSAELHEPTLRVLMRYGAAVGGGSR